MKIKSSGMRLFLPAVCWVLVIVLAAGSASAQWWRFGTDDTQPVFTDLLFNHISVLNVDQQMAFTVEDLDNDKVIVRGRAEVAQGRIGRVEASLDGGTTWQDIAFNERGMFAFEFRPELEKTYQFRIRALSTTGQASDDMLHSFDFRVARTDRRAEARQVFDKLVQRYMARDRSGFMDLVSRDFMGSEAALDSALSNDFRLFASIRIRPTIQRMAEFDGRWSIYFQFNRQVRSVRSGKLLQDRANTSLTLIREDGGYKLHELAAPLIFGLSDPSNVATFVTDEAVGQEVITVDQDGNVEKTEQGQTTESNSGAVSNIREGSVVLDSGYGYSLLTGQTMHIMLSSAYAFAPESNIIFLGDDVVGASILSGVSSLSAVSSVPENLGDPMSSVDGTELIVGRVYAFQFIDDTYAVVRLADEGTGPPNGPWTFEYRHQLNGTTEF